VSEIQRGAATALVFELLERAIRAQRDGGAAVQVIADLDEKTARAIGLWGEGSITLRMEPAFGQRTGDLPAWRTTKFSQRSA